LRTSNSKIWAELKKIQVDKSISVVFGGEGKREDIEKRVEQIKKQKELLNMDEEKFKERIASLSSGIGIISVGGFSEVEINEKKR